MSHQYNYNPVFTAPPHSMLDKASKEASILKTIRDKLNANPEAQKIIRLRDKSLRSRVRPPLKRKTFDNKFQRLRVIKNSVAAQARGVQPWELPAIVGEYKDRVSEDDSMKSDSEMQIDALQNGVELHNNPLHNGDQIQNNVLPSDKQSNVLQFGEGIPNISLQNKFKEGRASRLDEVIAQPLNSGIIRAPPPSMVHPPNLFSVVPPWAVQQWLMMSSMGTAGRGNMEGFGNVAGMSKNVQKYREAHSDEYEPNYNGKEYEPNEQDEQGSENENEDNNETKSLQYNQQDYYKGISNNNEWKMSYNQQTTQQPLPSVSAKGVYFQKEDELEY